MTFLARSFPALLSCRLAFLEPYVRNQNGQSLLFCLISASRPPTPRSCFRRPVAVLNISEYIVYLLLDPPSVFARTGYLLVFVPSRLPRRARNEYGPITLHLAPPSQFPLPSPFSIGVRPCAAASKLRSRYFGVIFRFSRKSLRKRSSDPCLYPLRGAFALIIVIGFMNI